MCQINLVIASADEFRLRMNGLQMKLSTNFTLRTENPYNPLLFSMPID